MADQWESDRIRDTLARAGFECGDNQAEMVVNTCCVSATAESKSLTALRRARSAHPGALIVATGCVVHSSLNERRLLVGADIVDAGLAGVHAFPYSPRPGTDAHGMGDPVMKAEKQSRPRAEALGNRLAEAHAARFMRRQAHVLAVGGRTARLDLA